MKKSKKVLIIGPFPQPISGVSLANKVVKEALDQSNEFETDFINTSYLIFQDAIGSFSFKKLFFFLTLNLKCFKIFKSDIVYITPGQTFFGVTKYTIFILLASLLKKRLFIHVHGNYLNSQYQQLKGVKRRLFYFLLSKFDKGIVLSKSLKDNLVPFIEEKNIFVISNFAEEFLYKDLKKTNTNSLKIVYLSNLMEEKGIIYLLEALKELEKRQIPYTAKIAGNIDNSLEEVIYEKIKSLKNTTYLGVVYGEKKKELLHWSTIFVLPTYYKMEGQPISILEALATQNVVITTNHAGIPDIIKSDINGYIVNTKSSVDIFDKLIVLYNNQSKIDEIGKANKQYFDNNFTLSKFNNEIIKTLSENTTAK